MNRKQLTALILCTIPVGVGAFALQGQTGGNGPRLFARVFQMVEQHAVDSLGSAELYERAARGLVKSLNDPYAELYSPEQLATFQRNTLGNNYGGVGMRIESQNGLITVVTVFPGTPGDQAGVQAGDRILMVDTTDMTGKPIEEVSARLTGTPGTTVSVTLARTGVAEPIRVTFTRAVIKVPAVSNALLFDGNVAYIGLQRFNENAADDVANAVLSLARQRPVGYILDLRGNPGGSLEESLEIGNLFLTPGVEIASVRHRGKAPEIYRANRPSVIDSVPIVVLVDQFSASASEIVAGSLQDHDRALVIGMSSFGKGLVQTLYPLEGGWALKLTTGKWYTPSGRSIQGEHKQLADGRFVEYAPDPEESDSSRRARPRFRSTGGRVVYGGGGITPDLLVRPDTLSTPEQEFLKVLGGRLGVLYTTLYEYALELKGTGTLRPDFTVEDAWRDELYRRLAGRELVIDRAVYDAARPLIDRTITQRLAALAFGDSTAFRRGSSEDRQLQVALEYLRQGRSQRELLARAAAQATSP